jgi:hypothetical protein
MSGSYEDGFNAGLAAAAKVADYWAEGHWRVTHDKRVRFNIYDMQRVNVMTAQEIAKDIRKLELCEDEGCPNHGMPHVCVDRQAVEAVRLCQAALLVAMEGRGYSGRELEALGAAKRVLDKHEPKS